MDDPTRLRLWLGDPIPDGGSDDDTFFKDAIIADLISLHGDLSSAAVEGWRIKLAHYVEMVNISDTTMSRDYSDLAEHARMMIEMYTKQGGTSSTLLPRATVSQIVRPYGVDQDLSEFGWWDVWPA